MLISKSMNQLAKKLELVQRIFNTTTPLTLKKVEEVLKSEKVSDWRDEISDAERKSIWEGSDEADWGELLPNESVIKEVRKRQLHVH